MHESYLFDALDVLARLRDIATLDHVASECRRLQIEAEMELLAARCEECETCPYRERKFEVVEVKPQPRLIE